jgi:hypothetical protein
MNTPIGQDWRMEKGLRMSLVDGEWFPSVVYLQNNVSPAQNKTNDRYTSLKTKGNQARNLAVPNCSSI